MHFKYFNQSFFNWLCLVRCCQIIQHKIFLTVSFLLEHFFHQTFTQILRSWLLRTLTSEADWFLFQYAFFYATHLFSISSLTKFWKFFVTEDESWWFEIAEETIKIIISELFDNSELKNCVNWKLLFNLQCKMYMICLLQFWTVVWGYRLK